MCVIVAASVVGLALISIAVYFIIALRSNGLADSIFIPQPFAEKNTFTYFKLSNELQVLLSKPNRSLNSTYIGWLISAKCWRRIRI
jgi:hypothetical protein